MKQTLAVYVLIFLAVVTANLPFLSERIFGALAYKKAGAVVVKPFWLRLCEVLASYVVVGAIGFAFEASIGNVFPQSWEFYAITLTLYLVLAYPGFVYRYLFKRSAR
jgi:hypothetical protein